MLIFNDIGCEAIINGPFSSEDLPPWNQLSSLDVNETHPAVVRCQVTCVNQQGLYHPAMVLIITSQEEFIPIFHYLDGVTDAYSRDGLYFEIQYKNISSCEAQNNYTMEFEYLIYSNTSKIDRSVVTCGIIFRAHPYQTNDVRWGNMFGVVRYRGPELVSTVPPPILTTAPRPELLLNEVRDLNHVFISCHELARIICETTCDAEVCDPMLRLDIPGPTLYQEHLIKYLPKENNQTGLYLLHDFNIARPRGRNIVVAEFIIAPESIMFHKIIATCQWSYKYSPEVTTNFSGEVYYILFQPIFGYSCTNNYYDYSRPISASGESEQILKLYYTDEKFKITIGIFSGAVIVFAVVTLILTIGLLYNARFRKRATTPDSSIEEQVSTLAVKLEDVSTAEEEVKQEESDQNEVHDSSLTEDKLDQKLPDIISSRNNEYKKNSTNPSITTSMTAK